MKPFYFYIALMLCIAMLSIPSGSQAFRCGDEIISSGDNMGRVLFRCGEPEYITGKKKEVRGSFGSASKHRGSISYSRGGYQEEEIKTEIWHYNCGANDFVYALTFKDDILVKEEEITRGYGENKCISRQERIKRGIE